MKTKTSKRAPKPGSSVNKPLVKLKRVKAKRDIGALQAGIARNTRAAVHDLVDKLPEDQLPEIKNRLEHVLERTSASKSKRTKSLKGIWANKGFENIDLEKEIRAARDAMQKQILDRHLRNELSS